MGVYRKVIRFKNNVENDILKFTEVQSNFSDTIYYLIQKEIHENGVRNLNEIIPAVRTTKYFSQNTEVQEKYGTKEIKSNVFEKKDETIFTEKTESVEDEKTKIIFSKCWED